MYTCWCPYGQENFCMGKTKKMIQHVRAHNSGHVSVSTEPTQLRTYKSLSYIYILNGYINFIYDSK